MKKFVFIVFLPLFMIGAVVLELSRSITYFAPAKDQNKFWSFLVFPILAPALLFFAVFFELWVKFSE